MPVIIIDNYDSFTFNLYQAVQEITDKSVIVYRNDQISIGQLLQLSPSGIILSPGPGHPSQSRDFGVCADVIRQAAQIACPILGVCLGHQGIVHHLGGTVIQAPSIVHGKTSNITITTSSPLFKGMESSFTAMRYHSLIAAEENLPNELEVCAREETHGLIMAVQHRNQSIYGVQFHPESIGTPQGKVILENFVALC